MCIRDSEYSLQVSFNNSPYIPSAFSPNNDGINDNFQIFFKDSDQIPKINYFQIFDRWGGLLYFEKDLDPFSPQGWWDGTTDNKILNTGVYVYQISIEYPNGEILEFSGDVSLMR